MQCVLEFERPLLSSHGVAVHNVTVGGHQAEFSHHDALANIGMGGSTEAHDCHRHPELKRKLYSALQESDEGDLSIAIPKEVHLRQTSSTGVVYNDGMTPFITVPSSYQRTNRCDP